MHNPSHYSCAAGHVVSQLSSGLWVEVLLRRRKVQCGAEHAFPLAVLDHSGVRVEQIHAGAGGCVWRGLWPCRKCVVEQAEPGPVERGAHAGAGLLTELVTLWWSRAGAVCSLRTASHSKDPCWDNSWWTVARETFMKCLLCKGPYTRAVKDCEESFLWGGRS